MRRWTGLSPRVRGNRNWRPLTMLTFWSIPARAGEPRRIAILKQLKGAYPRACGGTHFPALISAPQVGLSPRVRGNPERLNLVADDPRSIPARAGEPCSCSPSPRATSVYPRACGGTHILLHNVKLGKGLSPRVRGNPLAYFPAVGGLLRRNEMGGCRGLHLWTVVPQLVHPVLTTLSMEMVISNARAARHHARRR